MVDRSANADSLCRNEQDRRPLRLRVPKPIRHARQKFDRSPLLVREKIPRVIFHVQLGPSNESQHNHVSVKRFEWRELPPDHADH